MTDILELLENGRVDWSDEHQTTATVVTKNERLAIAEIKKLRARIAELEAALKPFADMQPVSSHLGLNIHSVSPGAIERARAALKGEKG